jgi:hypothetical protein
LAWSCQSPHKSHLVDFLLNIIEKLTTIFQS